MRLSTGGGGYPSMPCSRSRGGGVLSQHALQVLSQHGLQQVSGGGMPGLGGSALRGGCSGGCLFLGGGWYPSMHWGRPPGRDGCCCGRYASHWNAFLFFDICRCSLSTFNWIPCEPIWKQYRSRFRANINESVTKRVNVLHITVLCLLSKFSAQLYYQCSNTVVSTDLVLVLYFKYSPRAAQFVHHLLRLFQQVFSRYDSL